MGAPGDNKVRQLEPVRSGSAVSFATLGEQVEHGRSLGFFGREPELTLFRTMLGERPPCRVLIAHGPGGVGKSSLLASFHRLAHDRDTPVVRLDARNLSGDQDDIERHFQHAINGTTFRPGDPAALLVDSFEALHPMERWFRETLLTGLPENFRVVLAMRRQPEPDWQLDPGWARLTRIHELGGLPREAAGRLLKALQVPQRRFEALYNLTAGHPLALTLAGHLLRADPDRPLDPADTPELVRELSARHLADAPSPEARSALFACALARNLSEPLLAAMLERDDVGELFDWLRQQGFVRETARGLMAHELVGEALRTALEQRDPAIHRRLVRNGARYLLERIRSEGGEASIEDALFLMRGLPAVRGNFVVARDTGFAVDRVRNGDGAQLAELIERAWGPESRRWFETWLDHAPEWLAVLRDRSSRPIGMSFFLDVTTLDSGLARADPAVRAFRAHLDRHAPLRPGERAMLSRFLVADDGEGEITAGVVQLQCHNALLPVKVPRLAVSASVRLDTEANRMQARYAGIPPFKDTSFGLDGRRFFIMGHDWRVEPVTEWLEGITDRLIARDEPAGDAGRAEIMNEERFREAVREALHALARRDDLDRVQLSRSLVVRRTVDEDRAQSPGEATAALIREAVEALADHPRGTDLVAVLRHTYLHPAPKQRAAAHEAGLSYGTYRRRLREAVKALSTRLWQREMSAGSHDAG